MSASVVVEPAVHLVDDEAPVRDALTFLFTSHGLATRAYADGVTFLDALNGGPLRGCILLDVRMEPISGLQVHGAPSAIQPRRGGKPFHHRRLLRLLGLRRLDDRLRPLRRGRFRRRLGRLGRVHVRQVAREVPGFHAFGGESQGGVHGG